MLTNNIIRKLKFEIIDLDFNHRKIIEEQRLQLI